jgi:Bacterial Ig domain
VGVDDAFEVAENTTLDVAAPGVAANDSDPDADPISVALITATSDGEIVATQGGSFVYTPDPGFTGVDSFRYAVEDDQGGSTGLVVGVVITVTPTTPTTDPTMLAGAIADAEQSSGGGPSPASTDPRVTTTMDSAASPPASTASSAAFPAALGVTGTTSNVLIPAALFGAGVLVIAFGVRRARNNADEPFEQA